MKNKIFSFVIVSQGEGKPGDMEFETVFSTRDEGAKDELKQILLERNAGFRRASYARNRREVVVTAIDRKEAELWQQNPGRNRLTARPCVVGQVFESATAASGWIGLKHNEVAMYLSRASAGGDKQTVVRGITFAYLDDVPQAGQPTTRVIAPAAPAKA